MGDVSVLSKQFAQAVENYTNAQTKYPTARNSFPSSYFNKSEAEFWLGNYKKSLEEYKFSGLYGKMASVYAKAGERKAAVEAQEIAIALAKEEVKDPKFGGRVFDYTITEYEETLKKYKKI